MARCTGLLVSAVFLAITAMAGAQQAGAPSPQARARAVENSSTGPITLTGCLRSDGGVHTLLQNSTSQAFLLLAEPGKLAANTGRQVRVEARELPPEGTRPPHDLPRLQILKIETLSEQCPANIAPEANPGVPARPGRHQDSVEMPRYNDPGYLATTPAPVGDGTGQHVNGRAEGAPSPGSGDPRNLSPSPQDVPVQPPQADTGQTTKTGKKPDHPKQKKNDSDQGPPR